MFSVNSYMKVWEVEDKGNYTICQISSSKKNQQTGQYETDFSAKVKFVGKAHFKHPIAGQNIKILNCGVSNKYDKEKKTLYTNYVVFDCECDNETNTTNTAMTLNEDELPF